jgi:hypothetical protein
MPDYRVYNIGKDGHFQQSVALEFETDDVAIEFAKQLVDGHDVELWQRNSSTAICFADPLLWNVDIRFGQGIHQAPSFTPC